MKNIVLSVILGAFLMGCGSENSSSNSNSSTNSAKNSESLLKSPLEARDIKELEEWLPKGDSVGVYEYNSNQPNSPAALSSVNPATLNERQKKGQQIYSKWCLACHGEEMPGTKALQAAYEGAIPALLEARDDLVPELVDTFVRYGKHSMPMFRKIEINDEELKLLSEYLSRNAGQ